MIGIAARTRRAAQLDVKRDVPGLSSRYCGTQTALGAISTLSDLSGNTRHMTSSGVNRPTAAPCYEAGGRTAIRCFSTGATVPQQLTAANTTDHQHLHDPAGSTLIQVMVPRGIAAGIALSSFGNTTANGKGVFVEWQPGSTQLSITYSRGGSALGFGVSGVGSVLLSRVAIVTVRVNPTGTKFNMRIGGTQVVDAIWSTPASGASADPLRMGEYSRAPSEPFDGDILETLTFNRALSDAEVTRIENALKSFYGPAPLTPTTAPVASALSGTVRVLCVGDSITQGLTGATTRLGGYRQRIDEIRGTLPFTFDFVGTQTYGSFADNQHAGRSGWVIDNRINAGSLSGHTLGSTNAGDIGDELAAVDPHIVAVMLGINTLNAGADSVVLSRDAATDYLQLLLDIQSLKPNARIVVIPLPLTTGAGNRESRRQAFNIALGAVVVAARARGIIISVADTANLLLAGDLFDGLHPNDSGYQKLGDAIAVAIKHAAGYL